MSTTLTSANNSPRIDNGVIYWHEGDTFALQLDITLSDGTNNITLTDGKTILVNIYHQDILVHQFQFTSFPNNNQVVLNFNETVTRKFPKGKYNYNIVYIGNDITTIVANNLMEVED